MRDLKNKTRDIAFVGVMVTVIEVCKLCLLFLPNVELTSFWLIMCTLYFGRKSVYIVPVFILVEGIMFGMGIWWIMYLYAWPLLVLITWIFKNRDSAVFFSILSGIFGLSFGFLCSIPYYLMGALDGGIKGGLISGFTWWVAGIPYDIVHCIGNFALMFILYKPIGKIMLKISRQWEFEVGGCK